MKIYDLKIVIENIRGSYKKFADTVEEYPVLGVTFPVHYGYIEGYTGEDTHDLDVFVGSGDLFGYIRMSRPDVEGGVETKMYIQLSEKELSDVLLAYKPVIEETNSFKTEDELLAYIEQFRGKGIQRVGTIIYTENYKDLVQFYKTVFNPSTLFVQDTDINSLICLNIHGTYIMIETPEEGVSVSIGSSVRLRMNVGDVKEFSQKLTKLNIEHQYNNQSWGEVVDFRDIDGNSISVRDEKGFVEQISK